ncbi:hypothetical protein OROGR_032910 [Orobanche gracilis]
MGAEAERNQQTETLITVPVTVPDPNPITETQFVAWKLQKLPVLVLRTLNGDAPIPHRLLYPVILSSLGRSISDADTSARKAEASRKRAEDIAAGLVQMNGRELFVHEPWVFDNTHY